jgi:hypothetical protein
MREVLVYLVSIADFNVLGLFMAKKHDMNEKKFSVGHAPSSLPVPLIDKICASPTASPFKARKLKF